MKVHPQLLRTVHLLEDLRRNRRPKTLSIKFGPLGLESVVIDGEQLSAGEIEFLRQGKKIVDGGNAAKVI